jgi:hypothetical protein
MTSTILLNLLEQETQREKSEKGEQRLNLPEGGEP